MIVLISLAALAVWAVIATVETVSRDGYRPADFAWNYDTRMGSAAPIRMH